MLKRLAHPYKVVVYKIERQHVRVVVGFFAEPSGIGIKHSKTKKFDRMAQSLFKANLSNTCRQLMSGMCLHLPPTYHQIRG